MTHRSRAPQTTPSKETLDQTNLAQIGSLLWADAFTTPIIRLFDMSTFGKQLVLAPLAKTQLKMNSFFRGTQWSPAERYTDMSKTIFVVLFYGPIFPLGYWILTIALLVNFFVDKYCLMRVWKRVPPIDASVTRCERRATRAPGGRRTATFTAPLLLLPPPLDAGRAACTSHSPASCP